MTEQLKAIWKRVLSYTKSNWDINDYPLQYKMQKGEQGQYNVGELKPWAVQVVNWWTMTGLGNTKKEALEHLKINFKNYVERNKAPRPGTSVPLTFADTYEMNKLEDVAPEFFKNILDLNYYECFISDESSLTDFGKNNNETLQKINDIYDLGLSGLGDGNIARILNLIKNRE
jgi:hypothetical protein